MELSHEQPAARLLRAVRVDGPDAHASAPPRIVCLTGEPTEILWALGEGERVEGISARTCRPPGARGKLAKERFVQAEEVIEAKPDVIFGSWCGKPVDVDATCTRPGWEGVPAIQNGEIHEVPSATILQPGPGCLTDGLDQLEAVLAAVQSG